MLTFLLADYLYIVNSYRLIFDRKVDLTSSEEAGYYLHFKKLISVVGKIGVLRLIAEKSLILGFWRVALRFLQFPTTASGTRRYLIDNK